MSTAWNNTIAASAALVIAAALWLPTLAPAPAGPTAVVAAVTAPVLA